MLQKRKQHNNNNNDSIVVGVQPMRRQYFFQIKINEITFAFFQHFRQFFYRVPRAKSPSTR